MKSYKHLFDELIETENIERAILTASLGKRNRSEVQYRIENMEKTIDLMLYIVDELPEYKNHITVINDGIRMKKRIIHIPIFKQQILHHMIIQVLMPIFMKSMYKHVYGSIPGRGSHDAKMYIEKWIRKGHDVKYYLKMDIKKFFPSVDHKILKKRLKKIIRDKKFLKVLFYVIDTTETGLPIGFYTSQWFANWLLCPLDHYIKEILGAKYYIRYMDDIVIFSSSKKKLHEMRRLISNELKITYNLSIKENWQVERFHYKDKNGVDRGRDLDFMGFRFYKDRTVLRRTILFRSCNTIRRSVIKYKLNIHNSRRIVSYIGWYKHTDSHSLYMDRVIPYTTLFYLRNKISKYDSKKAKNTLSMNRNKVLTEEYNENVKK